MTFKLGWIAAALLAATLTAEGQSYPNRTVRIITGLFSGSSGDIAGRLLADKLASQLGQPVIIENRIGANGQVAARGVARSAPDGYTLFLTQSSTMVTAPLTSASVGFDVFKDFTPIMQAVSAPLYLLVNAGTGVSSTQEMVAYAKKNPGKLNYGSIGRGSVFHFQGEATKMAADIDMVHVPYASSNMPNIIGDLLADRLHVFFPAYPAVLSALPTGKAKLLGVFADQRLQTQPDIPLVNEAIPGITNVPSWFGLFGPAGMDARIVARLEAEVRTALKDPHLVRRLDELGMFPIASTPAEMVARLTRQIGEMMRLANQIGIRPE